MPIIPMLRSFGDDDGRTDDRDDLRVSKADGLGGGDEGESEVLALCDIWLKE